MGAGLESLAWSSTSHNQIYQSLELQKTRRPVAVAELSSRQGESASSGQSLGWLLQLWSPIYTALGCSMKTSN
jgi:hypothetical protein